MPMPRKHSLEKAARNIRATEEQEEERAKGVLSLWYLAEKLGYDRLTEDFHKPMMDEMDRQWRLRLPHTGEFWPRGHYKTTIEICAIIRAILENPDVTILVCHAVDEEVQKIVNETGTHFLQNEWLRQVARGAAPPKSKAGRWLKTNSFTVQNRTKYNRQPTLMGRSQGAELTGAHVDVIFLDDIIGRNTIEDSALPKVKSWYRSTVIPVLNPGGMIRVVGTRWDPDDIYGEWIKDSERGDKATWKCRVRSALETDGERDYKGKPVLFTMKEIRARREEVGPSDWAFQYMNDPSPAGEKPWDPSKCEHYSTLKDLQGTREIFTLADPAPARAGSAQGVGEKKRGDGSKDDWAIAVVAIIVRGQRQEIHLVDGSFSKEWTVDEGCDEQCRLMKKWRTNKAGVEAYGGLSRDYEVDMGRAARRNATSGLIYIRLAGNAGGAKNVRFAKLASRAKEQTFFICETCPPEFREMFLEQARGWMPLPGGRNSNKYDDCADIVARSTDASLDDYAPSAQAGWGEDENELWWQEEELPRQSRYCGI